MSILLLLLLAAVRPVRLACLRLPCSHHRAHLARDDHGLARYRSTAGQPLLVLLRLRLLRVRLLWPLRLLMLRLRLLPAGVSAWP